MYKGNLKFKLYMFLPIIIIFGKGIRKIQEQDNK